MAKSEGDISKSLKSSRIFASLGKKLQADATVTCRVQTIGKGIAN